MLTLELESLEALDPAGDEVIEAERATIAPETRLLGDFESDTAPRPGGIQSIRWEGEHLYVLLEGGAPP